MLPVLLLIEMICCVISKFPSFIKREVWIRIYTIKALDKKIPGGGKM